MLLKTLCELNALPNHEKEVRSFIYETIQPFVDEIKIDRMGNLIAVKNKNAKGKHICLAAHMDEVGMVIDFIDESGLLRFQTWGLDPRILPSKIVHIGKNRLKGVIGTKPIHLQKKDERKKALDLESLYIDIGALNKEDANKHVQIGDYVTFESSYVAFGNNKIKAKALDDRAGCANIIRILQSELTHKITAVFTVQEEVGLRGSKVAAQGIDADLYVIMEATVSNDVFDVKEEQAVTVLGKGPVFSLMDRASIYSKEIIAMFVACAQRNGITYQYRKSAVGANDAGSFQQAKGGAYVMSVSLATRYIHSPVSVLDRNDFEQVYQFIYHLIQEYNEGGRS